MHPADRAPYGHSSIAPGLTVASEREEQFE
jgi:hypothetical protein